MSAFVTTLWETASNSIYRFRWVDLQLDIFLKPDKPIYFDDDFEQKLSALEHDSLSEIPDLYKAYDQVFDINIPADQEQAREYATKALKWTLCSRRPLKISELAYAVAVQDDGSARPIEEDLILQLCSNFILKDIQGCLQFAHFSVTQYLEKRDLGFSRTEGDILAATTCLSYLNCPGSDLYGIFGRYATPYWPLHYQNVSGNPIQKLEDSHNINRDKLQKLEEKIEQFLYNGCDASPSFIRWTSAVSNTSEFLPWDENSLARSLESVSSAPSTPLFLACCFGLTTIVERLSTLKNTD